MATISQNEPRKSISFSPFWLVVLLLFVGLLVAATAVSQLNTFPESWNIRLHEPFNAFKRWTVVNQTSHWLFLYIFDPFSAVIDFFIRLIENTLLWLPWPVTLAGFFFLANRISGLRLGLLVTFCLLAMGLFGLWEESMQTLALMSFSVIVSLLIGIPLGIWSAQNGRVEAILKPIMDTMQTMPIFVYLIPVLLFFGIARVPSAIATIIYALPPAVRLTNLGLRAVPADALEAAAAFGSTDRQILRKVKLPMAMPSILAGVNQTIMMALSIVVLAALIGSGGLGDVVLKSLRRLNVGAALEAGLAIVVMAILLDRISMALGNIEYGRSRQFQGYRLLPDGWQAYGWVQRLEQGIGWIYGRFSAVQTQIETRLPTRYKTNSYAITVLLGLLILLLILLPLGVQLFPDSWNIGIDRPVDRLVLWMQVNLYDINDSGFGTGPLRDFLIIRVFRPLTTLLVEQIPWPVIVLLFTVTAWRSGDKKLAAGVVFMLLLIGLLGMWSFTMDTLAQTAVAVFCCIGFGIPLGIWASRYDWLDQLLRPLLDFLQTIPVFVYLVPVIMLFSTGSVAGLIASVLYAAVPVIRLTNLGIRQVDQTVKESAEAFGSTSWQRLLKVELPLALPTIMLGINQTIMLALAMVIIAGLIGATGLGFEVVQAFSNNNLGRSVEAGLAMVLLAIVIDRIAQAWAAKAAQSANLTASQ